MFAYVTYFLKDARGVVRRYGAVLMFGGFNKDDTVKWLVATRKPAQASDGYDGEDDGVDFATLAHYRFTLRHARDTVKE